MTIYYYYVRTYIIRLLCGWLTKSSVRESAENRVANAIAVVRLNIILLLIRSVPAELVLKKKKKIRGASVE